MRGNWPALLFLVSAQVAAVRIYLLPVDGLRDGREDGVWEETVLAVEKAGFVVHEAGLARLGDAFPADVADEVLALAARPGIERGVVGAFDPDAERQLEALGSPYQRAVLVPLGADPFAHADGADIVRLCCERMEPPHDPVTQGLLAVTAARGQAVAARPDIVDIDDLFLFRARMQAAGFDV